jgi:hypothetical protein
MKRKACKMVLLTLGGLIIAAVAGAIVMLLWNWLFPSIFGLAVINFWQALGLFIFARILFGRFGGKHWMGAHFRYHNPVRERWMKMTPEERKEFIKKRHSFLHDHHFDFWMKGGFGTSADFGTGADDTSTKENE